MKITDISLQAKNPNRVNISVDGKYLFSLDVFQVGELGVKRGGDYTEQQIAAFQTEGEFGKLYARTLEYCMLRPRSVKEVRDYLWKKTLSQKYKSRKTGEIKDRPGASKEITERVLERVADKGYVNDESFARWWIENRNQTKGSSLRKLRSELQAKGIASTVIETALGGSERSDAEEIKKIIAKKTKRYDDEQKLMQHLARQGFSYDDIKSALTDDQ